MKPQASSQADFSSSLFLNVTPRLTSRVWAAATIEICESTLVEHEGDAIWCLDQWAWFVWAPCGRPIPFRLPTGFGLSVGPPFDDLVEALEGAPVYWLDEKDVDWLGLMDLLVTLRGVGPAVESGIRRLRAAKAIARRTRIAETYAGEQ